MKQSALQNMYITLYCIILYEILTKAFLCFPGICAGVQIIEQTAASVESAIYLMLLFLPPEIGDKSCKTMPTLSVITLVLQFFTPSSIDTIHK